MTIVQRWKNCCENQYKSGGWYVFKRSSCTNTDCNQIFRVSRRYISGLCVSRGELITPISFTHVKFIIVKTTAARRRQENLIGMENLTFSQVFADLCVYQQCRSRFLNNSKLQNSLAKIAQSHIVSCKMNDFLQFPKISKNEKKNIKRLS